MTPEGQVKKDIRAWLVSRGLQPAGYKRPAKMTGWFYMPANNGMGVSGIPDFMGCIGPNARMFSIEAKRPVGGKVRGVQEERMKEIKDANGLVFVARSVDDILELEKYLEN